MLNIETTYVLDDLEVKWTGREASRITRSKTEQLFEVTPVDSIVGSWKRWVAFAQLFIIDKDSK